MGQNREATWLGAKLAWDMLQNFGDVWGKASQRKLLLFGVAGCEATRRVEFNTHEIEALDAVERFAEGGVVAGDVVRAIADLPRSLAVHFVGPVWRLTEFFKTDLSVAAWRSALVRTMEWEQPRGLAAVAREVLGNPFRPTRKQCPGCKGERFTGFQGSDSVADAFAIELMNRACRVCNRDNKTQEEWHGFVPGVEPAWLSADVLRMAASAYDDREFGELFMIADALEEAGCDEQDVLQHLRGFQRHPLCREADGHAPECWLPLEVGHCRGCWVLDLILDKG